MKTDAIDELLRKLGECAVLMHGQDGWEEPMRAIVAEWAAGRIFTERDVGAMVAAAIAAKVARSQQDAHDAMRYRFLRKPDNAIVYAKDPNAWGAGTSGLVRYDTPEQLDAAVDTAMAAASPGADEVKP